MDTAMRKGAKETERQQPYPRQIKPGVRYSSNLPEQNRNRELFRIRASRLADIFPDELVIQEKTVSVIRREFMVSCVETLPVKDIGRVVYVNGPLFAGLAILGKNPAHELKIKGVPKTIAVRAKEIVEGLLLEDKGVVEVPDWLHIDTRREMLEEAGKSPEH